LALSGLYCVLLLETSQADDTTSAPSTSSPSITINVPVLVSSIAALCCLICCCIGCRRSGQKQDNMQQNIQPEGGIELDPLDKQGDEKRDGVFVVRSDHETTIDYGGNMWVITPLPQMGNLESMLDREASRNNASAINNIGCRYVLSDESKQALEWFQRGASLGCLASLNNLGSCCLLGLGGQAIDHWRAVSYYKQAAETQRCLMAMNNLAQCYACGWGVEKDELKAVQMWKDLAMEPNHYVPSQHNLGLCYHKGLGGLVRNSAEAASWLTRAADAGWPASMTLLACMYLHGLGVNYDRKQAILWFSNASKKGHKAAQRLLQDLLEPTST